MRPMLQVNKHGELVTRMERKLDENDYHFDKPIDKYFTDHKVNKLIYESRKEQQRYKQMMKLEAPTTQSTFEDLYRKLRQEKIKPLIEKEKRMFETRANELDKKRRSISDFKNSQSLRTVSALNDFKRSESDKHLSPAFKLMSARSSFNEVPNYENLGTTKSVKLAKTQ